MRERGLPWHEAVSKVEPKSVSLEEGKAWRTREAEAGRPSSYEDFCRVHGLCVTCLGEGLVHNDNGVGFKVVGMDGDIRCSSDARCAAERERSLPCSAFRLNHPATRKLLQNQVTSGSTTTHPSMIFPWFIDIVWWQ